MCFECVLSLANCSTPFVFHATCHGRCLADDSVGIWAASCSYLPLSSAFHFTEAFHRSSTILLSQIRDSEIAVPQCVMNCIELWHVYNVGGMWGELSVGRWVQAWVHIRTCTCKRLHMTHGHMCLHASFTCMLASLPLNVQHSPMQTGFAVTALTYLL